MITLKHIESYGQKHVGFTEVYATQKLSTPMGAVIISFLPQFSNDLTRRVVATVLLEKPKEIWTDGEISDITQDIESEVMRLTNQKFDGGNPANWFYLQIFYIDSVDGLIYSTAGDFSYE